MTAKPKVFYMSDFFLFFYTDILKLEIIHSYVIKILGRFHFILLQARHDWNTMSLSQLCHYNIKTYIYGSKFKSVTDWFFLPDCHIYHSLVAYTCQSTVSLRLETVTVTVDEHTELQRCCSTLLRLDQTDSIYPPMVLTHWGRDKMADIFQTTFSNAFSWMKMSECRLRFHWSLFLRVQLTIFQHWFR